MSICHEKLSTRKSRRWEKKTGLIKLVHNSYWVDLMYSLKFFGQVFSFKFFFFQNRGELCRWSLFELLSVQDIGIDYSTDNKFSYDQQS